MNAQRIFGLVLVIALNAIFGASSASADVSCSASFDLNFNTINLINGSQNEAQSNIIVSCDGGTQGEVIRACVAIGSSRQMARASQGGSIGYHLSADGYGGTSWGSDIGTALPYVDVTIGGNGSGSHQLQIFGSILPNQSTAPTSQQNHQYTGHPDLVVVSDLAAGHADCSTIVTNQNIGIANVQADYVPACYMTVGALAFGTITSTLSGIPSSTSIDAQCSAAAPYSIALNYGTGPAVDPTVREMTSGANKLIYGIYLDGAHTRPWGFTAGVNVFGGVGTGSPSTIPVYGRIQPQTTPPSGSYSDVVVITIDY